MAKNSISLDDIRAAAEQKFGATEIAGVELRNILRLSKAERQALKEHQERKRSDEEIDEMSDDELFDDMFKLIEILVGDPEKSKRLKDELYDDGEPRIDLLQIVIEQYLEDQKAGKATQSQS